jgi:predicted GNAT superfamily acetyltransferase
LTAAEVRFQDIQGEAVSFRAAEFVPASQKEKVVKQNNKVNAIDDLRLLDATVILSLNNEHAKETSALDHAGLTTLLDMAFYARGIDRGATAFLIALDHNASYENPNFAWFKASGKPFAYIDRIIVSSSARGLGIGRLLYEDLFAMAKQAGQYRVVCEVNIEPPNPVSETFHEAMGFDGVGQATLHNGAKTVRYFEKKLC